MTAPTPDQPDDIETRAASWYSRARSGEMSAEQEREMAAWIEADPAHRSAYDAVERAWSGLDLLRAHPRVLAMRDALPRERSWPGHSMARRTLAACLAAGVIGAAGAGAWATWRPSDEFANQTFRTGIGEKATITLPDSSTVTLNTGTVLRTRADAKRRILYLDEGQAYFKVAKDKDHPFVVHAAGRTITALGTAFDVRVNDQQFAVTLVEGKVRVVNPVPAVRSSDVAAGEKQPAAPPEKVEATEMVAGSQLVAVDAQRFTVGRTDVVKATGWLRDQLIFQSEPLGAVVAEMNRYSRRQIVITDAEVASTLVSGNFRPGDVEGFTRAVQAYDYASIARQTGDTIELAAP